jgi:hypothetical protein
MATKEIFDAVNEGLNNVMPGRKIANMLANSYAEKAKKDINNIREDSPKEFDRAMANQTERTQGNVSTWKQNNRNIVRNAVGMEREPVETLDINVEENSFGKKSGGLPPSKPKLFGNKQTEWKKGGKVSSASTRADGIAKRGKTRGKLC